MRGAGDGYQGKTRRRAAVMRTLALGLVLFVTWLLLSGHDEVLLLALGVVSCAVTAWIARRMDVVDREGQPIHLGWRTLVYLPWLIVEIIKANLDVARRILDPRMPISPTVITLDASQKSELGQVIYANSITLTPGTVSLRLHDNQIDVHAIAEEAAEGLETGDMDRRVSVLEAQDGEVSA